MRRLSILLGMLGVAGAAALVLRFDAAEVFHAILSVGWGGALLLLLWQGLIFFVVGLAWRGVQPELPVRTLIWGRMVRDAATVCLPFSPVGGYVLGVRAVTLRGAPWTIAAAGTVVDVSVELGAQLVFALLGLGELLLARPGSNLILPIAIGLCVAMAGLLVILRFRRKLGHATFMVSHHLLGDRLLGDRLLGNAALTQGGLERLRDEMARLYGRPWRLLRGATMHLTGWFATGIGTWISLRLLGHPVGFPGVLALESLLDAVTSLAFVVPGAAGVQEAGYVGLGAAFGVPPDIALGVSLLRRAREVGWGLPILGLWQLQEVRRL